MSQNGDTILYGEALKSARFYRYTCLLLLFVSSTCGPYFLATTVLGTGPLLKVLRYLFLKAQLSRRQFLSTIILMCHVTHICHREVT